MAPRIIPNWMEIHKLWLKEMPEEFNKISQKYFFEFSPKMRLLVANNPILTALVFSAFFTTINIFTVATSKQVNPEALVWQL